MMTSWRLPLVPSMMVTVLARGRPLAPGRISRAGARDRSGLALPQKATGRPNGRPARWVTPGLVGRLRTRRIGRVLLRAPDQFERGLQRLVVRLVRRDIGLGASLLGAVGLEMAAQRGFAARIGTRLELVGNVLEHLDVGHDALGLDRAAGRREVARGGQPEGAVAGPKRDDGLH